MIFFSVIFLACRFGRDFLFGADWFRYFSLHNLSPAFLGICRIYGNFGHRPSPGDHSVWEKRGDGLYLFDLNRIL
ncbi:hypothetical protein ADIS_4815 [Lunatimonas lonarensis]|uniref:Uncharacterized protein n=1 Tax=Lunatimonas lonarensis TaxID=1232681 RepID=R7ZL00_9BACT|nr:hypothetical protein ADIS_4815 [Lunatimonas lonarensis]